MKLKQSGIGAKLFISYTFLSIYLMPVTNVQAYEIVKDFSLPSTVQYDSNVNMSRTNKQSAFRFIANPKVTLSSLNEINSFNFYGSLNVVRSTDRKNINDREDPTLGLGWTHAYESGAFTLNGRYGRQSTRLSEFNETGLVFNDGTSTNKAVNASLSYDLTERFTTRLSAGYNKQDYSLVTADFTDYDSDSFGLNFSYQNNEKLTTSIDLGYTKTDYGQSATSFPSNKSKSASLGINYTYSPVLDLRASLGMNKISTSSTSGFIATSAVNYQIDNDSVLSAGLSRNVSPSGLGNFIESDSLFVDYKKSLTSFDNVGAAFRWNRNNTINTISSKYIDVFYNRELTPDWTARGLLSARSLGGNNAGSATGYQLGFTLVFNNLNF